MKFTYLLLINSFLKKLFIYYLFIIYLLVIRYTWSLPNYHVFVYIFINYLLIVYEVYLFINYLLHMKFT